MTNSEQANFLKFVTSCPRQPLLGFKQLNPRFGIQRVQSYHTGSAANLPTAATCMNLLKLPQYDSVDILQEKLLYAIQSNSGFNISKSNDFILNIQTNNFNFQLGAVSGDSGFGFWPYTPDHSLIYNNLGKQIYRYIVTDSSTILDLKTKIGKYNYYYIYTDKFETGKSCGTLEGYFCISPYINLKTNSNQDQPFSLSCGINSNTDLSQCDQILSKLNITNITLNN
jgi:hypothetical protein